MMWLPKAWNTLPVDGDLTIGDYIDFDWELCTNQSTISDKDIIPEVLDHPMEQSSNKKDDDDAGVVEMRKPLMEKVKSAIGMLENNLYSDFGEDILKSIRQASHFIEHQARPHENRWT